MIIALGQIEVECGKPQDNVGRMLRMISSSAEKKAQLICFPEMCVGGYLLGDLYLDDDYCLDLMSYNAEIADAAQKYNIAVAFGNVYLEENIYDRIGGNKNIPHPNKDGRRRRYNAAYIYNKKGEPATRAINTLNLLPKGIQIKSNLPNYRFFDDVRYFFSMQDHIKEFGISNIGAYSPFDIDGINIGFALCEDLWCEDYREGEESINPTKYLAENGAEVIVNLSASPWTYGKKDARHKRVKKVLSDYRPINKARMPVSMFYVNCCGVQNNGKNIITFDGGSTIYDGAGNPVVVSNEMFKMDLLIASVSSNLQIENSNINSDLSSPNVLVKRDKIEEKYLAIKTAIQHFVKCNAVIGVSGGIDSAVDAALFADAIGPENVIGINMPTRYNSETTKNAAKELCDNLKIPYYVIPIEDMVEANRKALDKYSKLKKQDTFLQSLVEENIQAKIRGASVLSNIAQMENGIFVNNGNKIEVAIGYATLYGDWGGAIAPLGDLTKTEVYELGKYLNQHVFKKEVIPAASFNVAPSAELKENQKDPIIVEYHSAMIDKMTNYMIASATDFMEWWLEGKLEEKLGISNDVLQKYNLTNAEVFLKDLKFILSRERNQVFKRVQSVPIVVTSKTAYGYDRRESIMPSYTWTKKAEELEKRIRERGSYTFS